jgi:integrase
VVPPQDRSQNRAAWGTRAPRAGRAATPGRQPVRSARRARGRTFVGIQKPWQRVRGAAGLDDVRIHDLRHSFASIAVSGGDSLYLVGKVLGHRQSRTTERHAYLKDDPLRAVANRTSERIAAIM